MDEEHLDRLYSLPREEFIAARGALAKELKQDGDAEAAAGVAALRKPTLAAWALNEVARAESKVVEELFAAQEEIGTASSADALRQAGSRRQDLIAQLLRRAIEILEAGGHGGQAARDKIQMTLLAVGTDPEAAVAFRGGYLTGDVEPNSSWDLALAQAATSPVTKNDTAPVRRQSSRDSKELERLLEKAEQLEKRAAVATERLEEVKKEAKEAAAAAKKARTAADRKAATLGSDA